MKRMDNVEGRIKRIMADLFDLQADALAGETRLVEDLNIKSANRINLSVQLEEEFQIEINIFEILKLKTLQEIFDLVAGKVSG